MQTIGSDRAPQHTCGQPA